MTVQSMYNLCIKKKKKRKKKRHAPMTHEQKRHLQNKT